MRKFLGVLVFERDDNDSVLRFFLMDRTLSFVALCVFVNLLSQKSDENIHLQIYWRRFFLV
jgi:hypothetical protein